MGRRRQAREAALQALYFLDARKLQGEEALALYCLNFPPGKAVRPYFELLVNGVIARRDLIDGVMERYSENWKVFRMPLVDRNVIRMAIYEMFWQADVPFKVAINEAIDIGKTFGTEDSGPFINGILDRVRQALESGETGRGEQAVPKAAALSSPAD